VDVDHDGAFDLAHVTAADPHEPDTTVQGVALGILRNDAEFIAHAPADVARLLGALDRVSTLHTKVCDVTGGECVQQDDCSALACAACHDPWPCPTVNALTAALDGKA
jgi:hypothetical protein